MPRPNWTGYLRLNLVSVPVAAYTAAEPDEGKVRLHQLHEPCHSRIKYQKVCPIHGDVSNSEIVTGYEYTKGQYVIVDRKEKGADRSQSERVIELESFIAPGAVDPLWFSGGDYYLLPDGAAGKKPYLLLFRAMSDEDRYALGQALLWGHDHLVLVRPHEDLLTMSILKFASQLRSPGDFSDEVPSLRLSADEVRLGRTLVQAASTDKLDLTKYRDTSTDKLKEQIEAEIEGRHVVAPPEEEAPHVINLMDALRKSVAKVQGKPAKKSSAKRAAHHAKPRRKSS